MSKEENLKNMLIPRSDTLGLSPETVSAPPRFLILGTRISGAYGMANAFEKHLATLGFEDAQVDAIRDAANISNAFYNTPARTADYELEPPKGILRRLGNSILRREASLTQDNVSKDFPQGVVVFPQMRQYTLSGNGMFIPSPRVYIQDLCDKNQVPVIFMEDLHNENELADSVSAFTIGPKQITQ